MFRWRPYHCINRGRGFPKGAYRGLFWIITVLTGQIIPAVNAEFSFEAITAVLARVTIRYMDTHINQQRSETADIGRFADGAIGPADGLLINPRPIKFPSSYEYLQGCNANWAAPLPTEPWIALLLRGGCSDVDKVRIALAQNASAVLLFGGDTEAYLRKNTKLKGNAVVVYLLNRHGEHLSYLMANGTKINLRISRGPEVQFRVTSINRTSVLFVSVSFIVLMVVSLAWLVFYYIQRFRYINAKDKLARHLCSVAKKALSKVPVKHIKNNDKEISESECCAVCIEQYQVSESTRILPCKHQFHKACVDPWLLEHRTCPMCKMDILKYYGYVSNSDSNESRSNLRNINNNSSNVELGRTLRDPAVRSGRIPTSNAIVSVISHSEVPPNRSFNSEGASSNPVGECPGLHTRQSSTGFGATTTAVIRSMINSARPRVVPVVVPNSPTNNIEASSKIKDVGSSADLQMSTNNTENKEEDGVGGNAPSSNEDSSRTTSCGRPEEPSGRPKEQCYRTKEQIEDLRSNPPRHSNQSADYLDLEIETDIEYLVQEIMDLDSESDVSKSNSLIIIDQPSGGVGGRDRPASGNPKNPESDRRPMVGSVNVPMPTVECDPQAPSIGLSLNDISSVEAEEENNKSIEQQTSSGGNRRPSSHMVTITPHS